MEAGAFLLVRGLLAGVLLPALVASAAAAWLSRSRARSPALRNAGLVALFAVASALGSLAAAGVLPGPGALPLVNVLAEARRLPESGWRSELAPHLAGLAAELSRAAGVPPEPASLEPAVERMLAIVAEARALSEEAFPRSAGPLSHRLVVAGSPPGTVSSLLWTGMLDGALMVPVAAGLTGGLAVGLGTGLLAALGRCLLAGVAPLVALPTVLAGACGAAFGRRDAPSPIAAGVLGAATALAQLVWVALLAPPGGFGGPLILGGGLLALLHATGLALYVTVLDSYRLDEARREAERSATRARLELLTAQIRPHFLFNALNTISAAAAEDPRRTRHLLDCLARFLRRSLEPSAGRVTLAVELAGLEPYLELERARWPDRLTIAVDATPDALAASLPPLLLQPLVENAVTHGLRAGGEPLAVRIAARVDSARLVLAVSDDGAGVPAGRLAALERGEALGVGLASVRERVRQASPPGVTKLASPPGGGFTVAIELEAAR